MNVRMYLPLIWLAVLVGSASGQSGIYLDSVVGQVAPGKLAADETIVFLLNLRNTSGQRVEDIIHEFTISSPNGATWFPHLYIYPFDDSIHYVKWLDPDDAGPLGWHSSIPGDSIIFAGIFGNARSDHDTDPFTPDLFGNGSDTVIVGGFGDIGSGVIGIRDGLDLKAWSITIDSVDQGSVGKTLCIDSCSRGAQLWLWANDDLQFVPSWDGPHCFEIVADCCENLRGNVNRDWKDTIDISDLTSLVAWMFRSGITPPCMLEADINADSVYDILDLTYLVSYMFKSGPAPAACP